MLDNIPKIFIAIAAVAAVALATAIFLDIRSCARGSRSPESAQNPPAGYQGPDETRKPLSEASSAIPEPKDRTGAILDAVRTDKQTGRKDTLRILIPTNPREDEPWIVEDPDTTEHTWNVIWMPVRDPYFELGPSLSLGASIDLNTSPSPWVGLGLLKAFSKLGGGASLDLRGTGAFLSYEILDHMELGGSYRLIRFRDDAPRFALNLAYRF